MKCADCGGKPRPTSDKVLAEGSTVREPGEALCPGCSSRRVLMMRAVMALPNSLADIRAQRMAVSI
jgi:DNA-directed RNA polymerase subunit RPC12/RpoP